MLIVHDSFTTPFNKCPNIASLSRRSFVALLHLLTLSLYKSYFYYYYCYKYENNIYQSLESSTILSEKCVESSSLIIVIVIIMMIKKWRKQIESLIIFFALAAAVLHVINITQFISTSHTTCDSSFFFNK